MWHRGFFEYDGWLLDQCDALRDVPTEESVRAVRRALAQ